MVRVALDWTLDLCFTKDFASVAMDSNRKERARIEAAPLEPARAAARTA